MAHARLGVVLLPSDVMIGVWKTETFPARGQSPHMHLQVLHAEHRLVESTDLVEEGAPPNRPRGLPWTLQSQEANKSSPGF